MTIFTFNRKINTLIAFISVLGIFTIFLPWIEYPKLEKLLYGYHGDGFMLSFLFFLILCFALYKYFSKIPDPGKKINIYIFIAAFIILAISLQKISQFNREVSEYATDNPIMGYAAAGAKLSSGLYVISIISIAILILSAFSKMLSKTRNLIILLLAGLLLAAGIYFGSQALKPKISTSQLVEYLSSDYDKMSNSLINKQPGQFVDYVHPIIYMSMGGKQKMVEMMDEVYASVDVSNSEIIKIQKTERDGDDVQCLIFQRVTVRENGLTNTFTNKMIAFSYDGGKNWTFAGTEDKSFDEMREILPEIFEELRY